MGSAGDDNALNDLGNDAESDVPIVKLKMFHIGSVVMCNEDLIVGMPEKGRKK